jgi:glycosyltransferase involved in cell wall biosynthesis
MSERITPIETTEPGQPLVICSKSEWFPPTRREHAMARLASEHGHSVEFISRPRDVRYVRRAGLPAWLRGFTARCEREPVAAGITVRRRSTVIPAHRGTCSGATDNVVLRGVLRRCVSHTTVVTCCLPWDWPAVSASGAGRRVFDMADDWGELVPGQEARFARLFERIAAEADEIIIVNPTLAERFPGREPRLIPNGADASMLDRPAAKPDERRMVYIGTLTPRFDEELMLGVLELLPDWRLDLVGECMYPGRGAAPSPALERLLGRREQVSWHGPLPRDQAAGFLDRAAIAIAPHRPERSLGQDSMKFYDYAARGRPIVSTRWFPTSSGQELPPHLRVADTAADFANAVSAAASGLDDESETLRHWARARTWSTRWPLWSHAVFGLVGP